MKVCSEVNTNVLISMGLSLFVFGGGALVHDECSQANLTIVKECWSEDSKSIPDFLYFIGALMLFSAHVIGCASKQQCGTISHASKALNVMGAGGLFSGTVLNFIENYDQEKSILFVVASLFLLGGTSLVVTNLLDAAVYLMSACRPEAIDRDEMMPLVADQEGVQRHPLVASLCGISVEKLLALFNIITSLSFMSGGSLTIYSTVSDGGGEFDLQKNLPSLVYLSGATIFLSVSVSGLFKKSACENEAVINGRGLSVNSSS